MKKITLLLLLFTVSLGYSQVLLVDFEGGAYGGTLLYQNETQNDCPQPENGVMSQEPNPVPTGNPSATAVEIITDTAGNPWQNAQLFLDAGDEIDLTDPATKTVSVLVYSATATDILAKVVDPDGVNVAPEIATDAQHTGSGWETLIFDFNDAKDGTAPADRIFHRILFFPLWNEGGAGFGGGPYCGTQPLQTIWIDDIINTSVLGTQENELLTFKAFPNPTRDSWTIKAANNSIINIQVFDVLGKNVMSLNPSSNEAVIDGSSLGLGLYFAKVTSELGSDTLKLVKH